jgi:sugar/nucleoside kinase (ribokinase family)
VILTGGANRAILTSIGAIGAMDVRLVPALLIRRARHVHSGSFYLQAASRDALPAFFASARAAGTTTSFDTNWDPTGEWAGVDEMLRASDLFFPNAGEAQRITRLDDVEEAARALAATGAIGRSDGGPVVAVKLGPQGALAVRHGEPIVRVPATAVDVVDTIGAGDSFDAGFLRGWLDGADLRQCLEMGVACGALSTAAAGGVDGQPSLAELRRVLATAIPR